MPFKHPANCKTEGQRLSRCFRAEELLRIEHNRHIDDHSAVGVAHRKAMIAKQVIVMNVREKARVSGGIPPLSLEEKQTHRESTEWDSTINLGDI